MMHVDPFQEGYNRYMKSGRKRRESWIMIHTQSVVMMDRQELTVEVMMMQMVMIMMMIMMETCGTGRVCGDVTMMIGTSISARAYGAAAAAAATHEAQPCHCHDFFVYYHHHHHHRASSSLPVLITQPVTINSFFPKCKATL